MNNTQLITIGIFGLIGMLIVKKNRIFGLIIGLIVGFFIINMFGPGKICVDIFNPASTC